MMAMRALSDSKGSMKIRYQRSICAVPLEGLSLTKQASSSEGDCVSKGI
jgi:hypothetical protein